MQLHNVAVTIDEDAAVEVFDDEDGYTFRLGDQVAEMIEIHITDHTANSLVRQLAAADRMSETTLEYLAKQAQETLDERRKERHRRTLAAGEKLAETIS